MKEPKDWITINGQHVPIFEGESKREATSKFINKKMSRVAKNKDKYETIDRFKERKASNKLDNEPKKKMRFVKDKDNRYIISRGQESDEEAIRNYKRKYGDENERNEEEPTRREKLIKFTQENKEQIKKWADEYDEKTNRQAFEKAKRGEGLSAKEYFGFLGSDMKPGSVILEEFADGENAIVANDGNWVRESRIKEYNKNPKANQDAVYDDEKESNLKWKREERENPLPTLEEFRNKYKNAKNSFRDDEFIRKELERERIEEFKRRKRTNK